MMAIVSLSAGILYKLLSERKLFPWIILCFVTLLTGTLSYLNLGEILIYASSMIILILLFTVFSHSLLPGNIPLVTDIGEKTRGPLSMAMCHYTRKVTIIWAALFGVMASCSIVLAWVGPPWLWSLFFKCD